MNFIGSVMPTTITLKSLFWCAHWV
jgi:hypothetical protein